MPSPLAEAFLMGILNGCYETPSYTPQNKRRSGLRRTKYDLFTLHILKESTFALPYLKVVSKLYIMAVRCQRKNESNLDKHLIDIPISSVLLKYL